MKPEIPAERAFVVSMARLVCAWQWRAREPGPHSPHATCSTCRRLVFEDLHNLIGHLLFAAYIQGHEKAGVPESQDVTTDAPEFRALVTALSKRVREICDEYRERVVQSDPRTFEGGGQRPTSRRVD